MVAYSTADSYNLENITSSFRDREYQLVELPEDIVEDALHFQKPVQDSKILKEVFIFREGSVVFWNVPNEEQIEVLKLLASPSMNIEVNSYDREIVEEEKETLDYTISEDSKTRLTKGEIVLNPGLTASSKLYNVLNYDFYVQLRRF